MNKTGGAFLQGEFPSLLPFNSFEKQCLAAIQPYLDVEVRPRADRLEDCEEGLLDSLLREVGRLGLMGVAIPEEFGGIALSRTLIARFCEETARACPSCDSTAPATSSARVLLSVIRIDCALTSCSACAKRSAAIQPALPVASAITSTSEGPAIMSMPTLPNTSRLAAAT